MTTDMLNAPILAEKYRPGLVSECIFKDSGGRSYVAWDITNISYPTSYNDDAYAQFSFHSISKSSSWGTATYKVNDHGGIDGALRAAMNDYRALLEAVTKYGRPSPKP